MTTDSVVVVEDIAENSKRRPMVRSGPARRRADLQTSDGMSTLRGLACVWCRSTVTTTEQARGARCRMGRGTRQEHLRTHAQLRRAIASASRATPQQRVLAGDALMHARTSPRSSAGTATDVDEALRARRSARHRGLRARASSEAEVYGAMHVPAPICKGGGDRWRRTPTRSSAPAAEGVRGQPARPARAAGPLAGRARGNRQPPPRRGRRCGARECAPGLLTLLVLAMPGPPCALLYGLPVERESFTSS